MRFEHVEFDEPSQALAAGGKALCETLEQYIDSIAPVKGRAAATALTKLEECHMWIGKAIRDAQLSRKTEVPQEVS